MTGAGRNPPRSPAGGNLLQLGAVQHRHTGAVRRRGCRDVLRRHDQALGIQIAAVARALQELGDELGQPRDDADMRLLDIDEQRARPRIAAVGDRSVRRRDALHRHRLDLVLVRIEIRKAKDAQACRVLVELRDDEVIILALLDIEGRTAQRGAHGFMLVLVAVLQRLHFGIGVTAAAQDQLLERVIGTAGRRRAEHRNRDSGQRRVDVFPRLGGVGLAIGVRGQRLVHIFFGQLEAGAARRFAQRDAVDADLDFDDVLDAIGDAGVIFLLLDPARCVGDVGGVAADARTEALETATGAGAVDLRGLVARRFGEFFTDRGGKGIDGRRADRADIITRAATRRSLILTGGKRQRAHGGANDAKGAGREFLSHGKSC